MGNTTFCTSLAGEELGRVRSWGNDPHVQAEHELASPTRMCDMPQHLMEPVLVNAADRPRPRLRFDTEYLVLHPGRRRRHGHRRATGCAATSTPIRAKYLIGADGGAVAGRRGRRAADGRPDGRGGQHQHRLRRGPERSTPRTAPPPSTGCSRPAPTVGGIGAGLVRCVRPWNEWLIVWGYDVSAGAPDLTEEYALSVVRQLVGDDEIPVTIKSSSAWTVNEMYAETYANGRVFCAGDAVHRHPPSNGLGSNTSIQDSYNLAWKLKLVLDGVASPELLDTYTVERAPVGRQIVTRANQSIAETAPIFEALDGLSPQTPEQLWANIAARKDATEAAEKQRAALREAIAFKVYEFNAHGVDLNQRYTSAAVVPDGTPDPGFTRDPELYHQPTSRPGAKLPHAWITSGTRTLSTLDTVGQGRFTLLTGIGGEAWVRAAAAQPLDIATVVDRPGPGVRGPVRRLGRPARDLRRGRPPRTPRRLSWRSGTPTPPEDAERLLTDALRRILGHG